MRGTGLHLDEQLAGAQRRDDLDDAQGIEQLIERAVFSQRAKQRNEALHRWHENHAEGTERDAAHIGAEPRGAKPALVLRDPFDHRAGPYFVSIASFNLDERTRVIDASALSAQRQRSMRGHLRRPIGVTLSMLAFSAALAAQTPARPTPREAMDRALTPLREVTVALALTDDERTRVRDVSDRAEAWAAELVEAEHHRDLRTAQARGRRIAWLARVLRARVDSMRAQASAAAALSATVALRGAVTERRAARDRASEALVAAERQDVVSTRALPAPDVDASAMLGSDAAIVEAGR